MGFIKIDLRLQKSEVIAEFFSALIIDERIKLPKLGIEEILLARARPGLNATAISSNIISRFKEIGIPNGPLAEGIPNAMEEYTKLICEILVNAIQNDMRIDAVVDSGMQIASLGTNAAGPVLSNGSNLSPHTGIGVPR